jgi:hypothetical protein
MKRPVQFIHHAQYLLLWDIRRFGTTYPSHLEGSSSLALDDQTTLTSRKSEGLIYTAAEAWKSRFV